MNVVTRSLFAVIFAASASNCDASILNGSFLEGELGENPNPPAPGNLLYDTGAQNGNSLSNTLSWSFACSTCTGYGVSGTGSAKVINASLGASSSVTVTGSPTSTYISLSDTYADYYDSLTITGGTGSGVLALQYSLDGSITQSGTGPNVSSFLSLSDPYASSYQINNGAITSGTEADFFGNATTSDTVTFYIPFTYGTALFTELHLEAGASFGSGDSTTFTSTVDFYNTASLNSALVTGNSAAAITSDSGLLYGPNGITTSAPEPGTWLMALAAISVLALARKAAFTKATSGASAPRLLPWL